MKHIMNGRLLIDIYLLRSYGSRNLMIIFHFSSVSEQANNVRSTDTQKTSALVYGCDAAVAVEEPRFMALLFAPIVDSMYLRT